MISCNSQKIYTCTEYIPFSLWLCLQETIVYDGYTTREELNERFMQTEQRAEDDWTRSGSRNS